MMISYNTPMIKFKDVEFKENKYAHSVRYNASVIIGPYVLSIGYGDMMYGSGPKSDTYEVALFDEFDIVPLSDQTDCLGWVNSAEIDHIIDMLHETSGFGQACRVFKKTRWNRRFSMIGEYKYDDELV